MRSIGSGAGSTDMGNVSVRVPSIHPRVSIGPPDVPGHTREFARMAVSEQGDAAIVDGAFGLAMTALEFLWDSQLREDAAREFDAQGGVIEHTLLDERAL